MEEEVKVELRHKVDTFITVLEIRAKVMADTLRSAEEHGNPEIVAKWTAKLQAVNEIIGEAKNILTEET